MNHIFRVTWNRRLATWQVVSELSSAKGKSKTVKAGVGGASVLVAAVLALNAAQAADLPQGATVVGGQAVIHTSNKTMVVRQSSDQLAVDWQSFSVGKDHTVLFQQPSATSAALNRVLGSDVSLIQGRVQANGRLFLVNPNGVVFTPTAQVDVGSLVASTLNISPDDFMAGKYVFEGYSGASVENQGHIRASAGGTVALIAARIVNRGDIHAEGGHVLMGAGRKVVLDLGGPTTIEVQEGTLDALIDQGGAVRAAGGQVFLSARVARDLISSVINHDGLIDVTSVDALGGKVVMEADHIALSSNSSVEAKGATGGGQVLVGGDWQGRGDLRQAKTVNMASGARIDASAVGNGDGGKVVLWSDVSDPTASTDVHGLIAAKGGSDGGNGGQIETSGYHLQTSGVVVTAASEHGRGGLWLLDPVGDTSIDGSTDTGSGSFNTALNNGTSVTYAVTGGNLTVTGDITKSAGGDARLTLKSEGSIALNSNVDIASTSGALDVVLWADSDADNSGYILMSTASVASNGGNIVLAGGADGNTDGIPDGYAVSESGSIVVSGTSTRAFGGVMLSNSVLDARVGSSLDSNTGDVVMRGKSTYTGIDSANWAHGVSLFGSKVYGDAITAVGETTDASSDQYVYGLASTGNASPNNTQLNAYGDISLTGITAKPSTQFSIRWGTNHVMSSATGNISVDSTGQLAWLSTQTLSIASGSSFTFTSDYDAEWRNAIVGQGSLIKQGAGTLNMTRANSYTGGTTVDAGTLQLNSDTSDTLSDTGAVNVLTNGTLQLSYTDTVGSIEGNGSIILSSGKTLRAGNGADQTFRGVISGGGAFVKLGTGTLTLTGANTYTGSTTISSGQLIVESNMPSTASSSFGGAGYLSIQPSGNAFTSPFDTTSAGFTFGSSLGGLTIGKASSVTNANVTLGSALTVAGFVKIYGNKVNINGDLNTTSGGAGGDVLIKASGDISLAGAKSISTNGGDVILWANSDGADSNGSVFVRKGSSITTDGGHLWLGGGSGTATWNGLTVGDGYAAGGTLISADDYYNDGKINGTVTAGVYLEATTLSTIGGDMAFFGQNSAHAGGIVTYGVNSLNAGSGTVAMDGISTGANGKYGLTIGLANSMRSASLDINSSSASPSAIVIHGQSATKYGVSIEGITTLAATGGGGIQLTAVGGGSTGFTALRLGYQTSSNGELNMLADSGAIVLDTGRYGIDVQGAGSIYLGRKNATAVTASTSDITLIADDFTSNGPLQFNTAGALTVSPRTGYSFASTFNTNNLAYSADVSGLTIGHATNTGAITVGSVTSIGGPIALYGGAIAVNAKLQATGTNTITLQGSGNVTDGTNGYVIADKLALKGQGNFTLDSSRNDVNTLAAGNDDGSAVGALTLVNSGAMEIGTVNPTGITATGAVSIATLSGDLTVSQDVRTTNTSANAIVLNAGRSAAAGTAAGGDIVLSGNPTIRAGSGGQVKLYTGSKLNTAMHDWVTGLSGLKIGSADETTSITNSSTYLAIYREALTIPLYLRLLAGGSSYYGDVPAFSYALYDASTGGSAVTDANATGTATWGGTVPTATSNAGTYTLTYASGITLGNAAYELNAGGSMVWTVNPRPITVTSGDASRIYGAANPTVTAFTVLDVDGDSTLPNSDAIASVTQTIATTANATANAGSSHAITPSAAEFGGGSSSNYAVIYAAGSLTIGKAHLTVTADDQSRLYGQANPTFSTTITGYVNGENASSAGVSGSATGSSTATATTGVGSVAITGSVGNLSASNYDFTAANGMLTIGKAHLTVTADDQSRLYGQANPTFSTTITGFANGENASSAGVSGSATGSSAATATTGVGSVAITGSVGNLSASNYDFTAANGMLTIDKAHLTVTADDQSRLYGQANPTFSTTITGFANGENASSAGVSGSATGSSTATATTGVGSVAITGSVGNLSASNYDFTAANGTLTIGKAHLTVTADDQSRLYGQANPTFSTTITGFVNGENASSAGVSGSATGSSTATATTGVGSVAITGSVGNLSASNYDFTAANGTLTIGKADATVTTNSATVVYNGALQSVGGFTAEGLVNGETAEVLTGVTTAGGSGTNVGTYALIASGTDNNYKLTFVDGALTIDPRSIVLALTREASSKKYGEADPTLEVNATGDGLAVGDYILDVTGAMSRMAGEDVGDYLVALGAGVKAGNYSITFSQVDRTMAIEPRDIALVATSVSKTYGEVDPSLAVSVANSASDEGLAAGDRLADVTGTLRREVGEEVGAYDLALGYGRKANNYKVTFESDNNALTIVPSVVVAVAAEPMADVSAATLNATRATAVATLPNAELSGGLMLIPVTLGQVSANAAQGIANVTGGDTSNLVSTAHALGYMGMLVVDGGVALPTQTEKKDGE